MAASKCFMFMYFLLPHWVPVTSGTSTKMSRTVAWAEWAYKRHKICVTVTKGKAKSFPSYSASFVVCMLANKKQRS